VAQCVGPEFKLQNTKKKNKKGLGGVVQAVQHLPTKREDLSTKPSITKKKKKKGQVFTY
jgi:hypothetical protein